MSTIVSEGMCDAAPRQVMTMAAFHEDNSARLRRWALGMGYAVRPKRLGSLPHVAKATAAWLANPSRPQFDPARAVDEADGLCGVGNDLSAETLMRAYAQGVFPFCHAGPMKWWSPAQRMVVAPSAMHIGKNLKRTLRKTEFSVTFDRAFADVMRACAEPRAGHWQLTWLTPRMMRAFQRLFDASHAHSFEVWSKDGELVGGGYGLSVGRVFFTESQFSRVRDASKIGFASLNHHLASWGYVLNDGKNATPYLEEIGFSLMPRAEFAAVLREHAHGGGRPGRWVPEAGPAEVAGG